MDGLIIQGLRRQDFFCLEAYCSALLEVESYFLHPSELAVAIDLFVETARADI